MTSTLEFIPPSPETIGTLEEYSISEATIRHLGNDALMGILYEEYGEERDGAKVILGAE